MTTLPWPACVDHRRAALSNWHAGRTGMAADTLRGTPFLPPARYTVQRRGMVGVILRQVCAACQAASGDPIFADLGEPHGC